MSRLIFYISYAFRNLWRNPRWTLFAMFAVAAGVATVVALRSLGLAIDDSLKRNVQASNKGDITLTRSGGPGGFNFGTSSSANVFDDAQMTQIEAWAVQNDATLAAYSAFNLQVAPVDQPAPLFSFMTGLFIDPATYPPVGEIRAVQPRQALISDLLTADHEVIISENLAQTQGFKVGERIQLTGSPTPFTIVGIAPSEAEADLRNFFSAFFGFVYLHIDHAPELNLNPEPNRLSIALPDGTSLERITEAGRELREIMRGAPGSTRVLTVPAILEQNAIIADAIGRFVVVMGLGALLIGGVGIINTMLVMVRRRTEEIAALKTFGLKGRQIASLFMIEALMLGVGGSVLGAGAGALLSRVANAYGERFILQAIPWRVYPEALVFGLVLGVVVTAVFGVIPVLTAVRVRPAIILRPNENHIPALGVLQSLGVTLFVVVALGVIAGQIIGPLPSGVRTFAAFPLPQNITAGLLLVATTLAVLGLLTLVLWLVIWLVGKFPSFGWVDLNLALRNLTTRRLRTATTLLAISTGIFAISSISFYGSGVQQILRVALGDSFGGDVLVISPASFASRTGSAAEGSQVLLERTLDDLGEAVLYRTLFQTFDGRVMVVDDLSLRDIDPDVDRDALVEAMSEAGRNADFEAMDDIRRQLETLQTPVSIASYRTDNPDLQNRVYRGRDITADDIGTNRAVIMTDSRMIEWGVDVGSTITVEVQGRDYTLEVVGLARSNDGFQQDAFADVTVPFGTLSAAQPNFQFSSVQSAPGRRGDVQQAISALPFFFTVDVRLLDAIIARLIDQFSALPFLVGLLSLGAAAVIMANTVALATFERRRQIGILKAVGLKRRRVVGVMLLENTIISLLGAVIGIGASVVGLALLTAFGLDDAIFLPDDARPVAVALVLAALVIGLSATLFSARPAVNERVMNVLRYD
ncbi:MAG: FtsX-like permease family protein [Anaerolineaceae bacterium]|nr:MAG: FtsX-like permease family protein [Anaerolineaceae bacterium]